MRYYAIGYEEKDGALFFYAYTCKFLSERREITKEWFDSIKPSFSLPGKNNKHLSGIYFPPEL